MLLGDAQKLKPIQTISIVTQAQGPPEDSEAVRQLHICAFYFMINVALNVIILYIH